MLQVFLDTLGFDTLRAREVRLQMGIPWYRLLPERPGFVDFFGDFGADWLKECNVLDLYTVVRKVCH